MMDICDEAATHPIINRELHPNIEKAIRIVIEADYPNDEKVNRMLTVINLIWLKADIMESRR